MKKLFGLFFLMVVANGLAQENTELNTNNNELKINGLYTILSIPEFTYERLLNDESAIGVSVGFSLEDDIEYNFILLPYYRIYFGEERAAGFFLEANSLFLSGKTNTDSNEVGFGFGIALGKKYVTPKGWVGELMIGASRNFTNDNITEVYPRFGISIGKRF